MNVYQNFKILSFNYSPNFVFSLTVLRTISYHSITPPHAHTPSTMVRTKLGSFPAKGKRKNTVAKALKAAKAVPRKRLAINPKTQPMLNKLRSEILDKVLSLQDDVDMFFRDNDNASSWTPETLETLRHLLGQANAGLALACHDNCKDFEKAITPAPLRGAGPSVSGN